MANAFGVALDDGIGVLERLVGQEGRMVTTHDDRYAAPAKTVSNLVGAPRRVGLDGHRDEVGIDVERQRLEPFVEQFDIDVVRGQGLEYGETQGLHRVRRAVVVEVGTDERNLHGARQALTMSRVLL